MEFENDVVMLTGAGGRLGRPCALAFAAEGARLLLTDMATPALEETARLARARGATVVAVPGDVTRRADVEAALAEGRRALGPVDALVNFAGYVPVSPVLEVGEEEWDRVFAVNVKGTMLCCQAVGREMVARGAAGRIVNISSRAVVPPLGGFIGYTVAKAAIITLTQALAREVPRGVTVNAVLPSTMDTPANRRAMPDADRSGWVTTDAVAEVIAYLASDGAGMISGTVIPV